MKLKFNTHHPSPFHDPRYAGHKTKPLLYTLKNNTAGLGISQHSAQVDQWWERAFDKQLNDMTVNTDGKGVTVTAKKSEMVLRATGRWISFVSAGKLKGGNMVGDDDKDEEEKKKIKEEVKEEGWETETDVAMTGTSTPVEKETKEVKKARKKKEKEEKAAKKLEKGKRREEKEARRLRRAERKKRREKREEKRTKRKQK